MSWRSKKSLESPGSSKPATWIPGNKLPSLKLYADREIVLAASTSANTIIHALTKEFSEMISKQANELDTKTFILK